MQKSEICGVERCVGVYFSIIISVGRLTPFGFSDPCFRKGGRSDQLPLSTSCSVLVPGQHMVMISIYYTTFYFRR
jgi:hypothetical protein